MGLQSFPAPLLFDAKYRKWRFRCAILLYLAVLVLGSIPGARADVGEYASGLVLHAGTYCVIALLLFSGSEGSPWSKACKSFLTVALMGALDEYVQSFFPYRSADVTDWMVDVIAGLVASCVLALIWPQDAGSNRDLSRPFDHGEIVPAGATDERSEKAADRLDR
jgi:VanZ family protein